MRFWSTLLLAFSLLPTLASLAPAQTNSRSNPGAVAGVGWKLRYLDANAKLARPDQTPTEFGEEEINAYFASGEVKLPSGVQSVHFAGEPGVVTGTARVDFDQLRSEHNSSNPLLSVFTGVHEAIVIAHAHGEGGQAFVQVDSVSLDGVQIPRFLLQLFAEKYLEPKHPGIGLDSRFTLPARIATAVVGLHKLTVVQK